MNDFKFLQTLPTPKKIDPLPKVEVDIVQESEYRVYTLNINNTIKKIGVPINLVEKFDQFIEQNEVDDLSMFNIIEIE